MSAQPNQLANVDEHALPTPERDLLISLRQGMLMLSKCNPTPEQYRAWRLMIVAIEKYLGIEKS